MKSLTRSILFVAFAASLVLIQGCGGSENGPTVAEVTKMKLSAHTWNLTQALVDGVDKTNSYKGLTLRFSDAGYTAADVTPSWPVNGTWKFGTDEAKTIIRGDGLQIEILEVGDATLKISYTWATATFKPGRTASFAGKHTLTFGANP